MSESVNEPLYVDAREVSARTSIPVATLRYWRGRNEGPPWAKFGRSVRYPVAGLNAWLAARTRGVQA